MKPMTMKNALIRIRLLITATVAVASLAATAYAAVPGITGPVFNLTAQPAYLTQPDGQAIYSWGYGCSQTPSGYAPAPIANTFCNSMQVPGPTLIVTEGQTVTVNLTNNLPTSAGNTSILFPGFQVASSGGAPGLLTQEAAPGGTVTYKFVAGSPGTRSYYSGTQSDLQIEMGMYGAMIVLPARVPTTCVNTQNDRARGAYLSSIGQPTEGDFRLAAAAYDNAKTCYDREYLFQFSEIDPRIHDAAFKLLPSRITLRTS